VILPTLLFNGRSWLWPAAAVLAAVLVFLGWSYRAAPRGFVRWICLGLKLAGVAALAVCLLEPLWSGQRARPGANLVAIVADNSMGLQIKDRGQTRSRGESLRDLLNPQRQNWQGALEENFEVRRYLFDARVQATKDFSELTFDGRASAIGAALRTMADRYRNRPLAGVLLLTDGNATDLHAAPDLAGLPPIYPVVIGEQGPARDISVQQARVSQTDFEDAPVSVQADVTALGYSGEPIVAQLLDTTGKKVEELTLSARKANDTLAFHFRFRPAKPGLSFYRLNVRAKSELGTPASTQEATLANNSRVLSVDRGHGPYRILYVTGRPNWEFKFLNRAAQEDDQLQLVALMRVAKREPKFAFRGRAGESSNPLFRGFENQSAEQVESYDQPVFVRLNTRDKFELRAGFPSTPEELYGYHAVIIDDLEAEFFTPQQAALMQKYISERGAGLLMLGGMECFQEGNYARTPIGDMLPVYLDKPEPGKPPEQLHLSLTREGWLQPWARLRDNESDEKSRLGAMPPFLVLNRVREAKPGATTIAEVTDAAGKKYPALVAQRFGRGRTAALMIGDVWHWGLHDADSHHDMDKAWRQLLRWLVADVPNEVELTAEPQPDDAAGAMQLQVRVRDQKFQPMDNAAVLVEVQPVMTEGGTAGTNSIRLRAEPSASEAGMYQVAYVPHLTGGYRATAFVTNSVGAEVGRPAAGWTTDMAAEEFRSLTPNVALLEDIARKTGGEIISASKLNEFARKLPQHHAPVMEAWTFPLWHTPVMFGFALACLVSEWGLRRWKGMP
jgi:uncharacterized membrane protein